MDNRHWSKIKEVHCGLEPDFYEHIKPISSIQNKMVCIGRLCEQKGQVLIIEALNLLKQKNVNFYLINLYL